MHPPACPRASRSVLSLFLGLLTLFVMIAGPRMAHGQSVPLIPAPVCNPQTSYVGWDNGQPAVNSLGPHTATARNGEVLRMTAARPGGFPAGRPYYSTSRANHQVTLGGGPGARAVFAFSTPRADLMFHAGDILGTQDELLITGYLGEARSIWNSPLWSRAPMSPGRT